jgi:hypothetical protein
VNDLDQIDRAAVRLRAADGVADVLAVGFDAFEVIRVAARDCEDRASELFAAFLLAAGAAVEGRDELLAAPSLPRGRGEPASPGVAPPGVEVGEIADALAALGGLLTARLWEAAAAAGDARDEVACKNGAQAAEQVQQLLGGGDDAHVR